MGSNIGIGILVIIYCILLVIFLSGENKTKKQEYLRTIVGGIGFIALIYFINFTNKYDASSLRKNGIKTVGKVIGFGRKNSINWEFKTKNGKRIRVKNNSKFMGLRIGEYYEAKYDKTAFKNAEIILSKPVINFKSTDTLSEYKFPYGKIESSNVYITFEYEFKGEKYRRRQKLDRKEKWETKDDFIILVDVNNPKIAYIKPALK